MNWIFIARRLIISVIIFIVFYFLWPLRSVRDSEIGAVLCYARRFFFIVVVVVVDDENYLSNRISTLLLERKMHRFV